MTLPSEEVSALKRTHEFLRELLTGPRLPMKVLRDKAYSCLRHYPWDIHINERWSDDVCEHGTDRQWCPKCDKEDDDDK